MRSALELLILRLAALLMPWSERSGWRREWESELWYVQRRNRQAVAFCLGAFKDALWVRRNSPKERQTLLQSPWHCVLLLASLAALTTSLGFYLPGPRAILRSEGVFIHLLLVGISLLVLPVATSLSLGEYPVTAHSPNRAMRLRRWIFLCMKIVLILPIVAFGTLDLLHVIGASVLQGDVTIAGYVLAFRWILKDQRQRCPLCLRLLTNPTHIGERSNTLLGWYGRELMCERGHGLLYVPEIKSSYTTQRWLYLDPSWKSLFS